MSFIKLCTVDNSYEANFIRDDLMDKGIECIVTNENFTTLMPHMNGILDAGIQILIEEENFEKAKQVLTLRQNGINVSCPICESTNIKFGLGTTHRFQRLITIAISALNAIPFNNIKNIYYCNDCKEEFFLSGLQNP